MLESHLEDPRSIAEHTKAMLEEMKKPKPRDAILTQLMKSTFQDRRLFVQNDAKTVTEAAFLKKLCKDYLSISS